MATKKKAPHETSTAIDPFIAHVMELAGNKRIRPGVPPPPWHGPVAQRLRQLYAHRLEHVERIPHLQENPPIIGIPWDQWAELSQERTHNLDPKRPHPWDGIGVESKGKSYDDAIAVFGRHWENGATCGNAYFWFYPVVRS